MPRPNLLLIHTDQQRWDALGANGNDEIHTPNLDRMAAGGVNLDRYFVNAPVCMPSRASYLTGLYPSELRIFGNGVTLPEDVPTLPEFLGARGYETANIGKLHFHPHADRDHTQPHPDYGFDHLEISDEPGCYKDDYRAWVRERAPDQLDEISIGLPPAAETWQDMMGVEDGIEHRDPRFVADAVPFEADADLTHSAFVGRRTSEYVAAHADDSDPFLCVAGFYSPHSPWVVPQRYLDLYDREEITVPDLPAHLRAERAEREIDEDAPPSQQVTFDEDERRAVRHGYYAMVSEVDRWVGEILDALENAGIADETVVVFTSDHGEDLGDHLTYGKGWPGWDSISRVPMLVHWPEGIESPGRTESDLVEAVDLVPTLLDAAGVAVPSDLQGESFLPLLTDERERYEGRDSALTESRNGKILRTDRYRYTVTADGTEQLFDLETDPGEFHDRSDDDEHADALAGLRHRLIQRTTTVDREGERPIDYQY
ncbi:sulfatase family protein [Halosimplex pelagicum]|uniref:Sulfatase-like hydrolase/transferase n=1 Tax=Halosimplex pelagicum TaxID=869886 RepID=A0A7D5PBY8_9EURY|nr:sulfatase-like hydrolase/transferase [Halosimplex pelagicum]QLH82058.1 sulfatase-like hydrolase/transferase [Halosimplex pelagicum]